MYGVVVFVEEVSAPTLTERPHILLKKPESLAVAVNLSVLFGNAPIGAGRTAEQKVIALELREIAVIYIPVMNDYGEITL